MGLLYLDEYSTLSRGAHDLCTSWRLIIYFIRLHGSLYIYYHWLSEMRLSPSIASLSLSLPPQTIYASPNFTEINEDRSQPYKRALFQTNMEIFVLDLILWEIAVTREIGSGKWLLLIRLKRVQECITEYSNPISFVSIMLLLWDIFI